MARVTAEELAELKRDLLPADRERLLELACAFVEMASAAEVQFMNDALGHWARRFEKADHGDVEAILEAVQGAGVAYRRRTGKRRSWTV
jgi:hypothetical protein